MTAASMLAWWDALLSGSQGGTLLTIVLMAVITVVSRSFFFISDAEWTLPRWAQRGLQYAPMAALSCNRFSPRLAGGPVQANRRGWPCCGHG